ncbi:mgpp2cl-1, protein phosphatase 2C-like protein 1 [Savitreella phatthalungensis]
MTTPQTGKRRSLSVTLAQLSRMRPFANNSPQENQAMQNRTSRRRQSLEESAASAQQQTINSAGEQRVRSANSFRVGVTEDRNRKCRRTMEDTHSFVCDYMHEQDCGYFAIFDGHAGKQAAEYCGSRFHIILADIIKRNPDRPITDLLDATFTYVDAAMEKMHFRNQGCTAATALLRWEQRRMASRPSVASSSTPAPEVLQTPKVSQRKSGAGDLIPPATSSLRRLSQGGSSAQAPAVFADDESVADTETPVDERRESVLSNSAVSVTSEHPNQQDIRNERRQVLYTANAGDARVVLCRKGAAVRLSYDHKGSDAQEGVRVQNAGGTILNNRVNGVLAVTRALGDSYMKELVTAHPYTTETVLIPGEDEFMILACDGLWDVCTDQEAVDLVRGIEDPNAASKVLVEHALREYSTDNLTVMVVRLGVNGSSNRERAAEASSTGADLEREVSNISQAVSVTSDAHAGRAPPVSLESPLRSETRHTGENPASAAASSPVAPSSGQGQVEFGAPLQQVVSPSRVAASPNMTAVQEEREGAE